MADFKHFLEMCPITEIKQDLFHFNIPNDSLKTDVGFMNDSASPTELKGSQWSCIDPIGDYACLINYYT